MTTVHRGLFAHAVDKDTLELFHGSVGVDAVSGRITFVAKSDAEHQAAKDAHGFNDSDTVDHGNRVILPGFVDTHAHAPQYVFTGSVSHISVSAFLNGTNTVFYIIQSTSLPLQLDYRFVKNR
jgi:guanine deaminase